MRAGGGGRGWAEGCGSAANHSPPHLPPHPDPQDFPNPRETQDQACGFWVWAFEAPWECGPKGSRGSSRAALNAMNLWDPLESQDS